MIDQKDKEMLLQDMIAMFEKKIGGQVKSKFDRFKDPVVESEEEESKETFPTESSEEDVEESGSEQPESDSPDEVSDLVDESDEEVNPALAAFKARLEKKNSPVKAFSFKPKKKM